MDPEKTGDRSRLPTHAAHAADETLSLRVSRHTPLRLLAAKARTSFKSTLQQSRPDLRRLAHGNQEVHTTKSTGRPPLVCLVRCGSLQRCVLLLLSQVFMCTASRRTQGFFPCPRFLTRLGTKLPSRRTVGHLPTTRVKLCTR